MKKQNKIEIIEILRWRKNRTVKVKFMQDMLPNNK